MSLPLTALLVLAGCWVLVSRRKTLPKSQNPSKRAAEAALERLAKSEVIPKPIARATNPTFTPSIRQHAAAAAIERLKTNPIVITERPTSPTTPTISRRPILQRLAAARNAAVTATPPSAPACLFHIHARCNDALQKTLDWPHASLAANHGQPAGMQELGEVKDVDDVRELFDQVYMLLFGTEMEHVRDMCYSLEDLRRCLEVENEPPEAGIMGECVFDLKRCSHTSNSILSCGGPTAIHIYLQHSRSRLRVAMTIAHELMHVYCHGQKHLAGRLCVVLPSEEGLCELVAFYTGAFMVGGLQAPPQHNRLTRGMLRQELAGVMGHLRGRQMDHYTQYKEPFLKAYDEFRASGTSLYEYVSHAIRKGGIWNI